MNKPEATGRIIQWAIELNQFNIEYHSRTAIKAQELVDFIVEFTILDKEGDTDELERWTIQTDSSSVQKKGRVGSLSLPPKKRYSSMEFS